MYPDVSHYKMWSINKREHDQALSRASSGSVWQSGSSLCMVEKARSGFRGTNKPLKI